MSDTALEPLVEPDLSSGSRPGVAALRALTRNRAALLGSVILLVLAVVAVLAPLLTPYDPTKQDLASAFDGPSASHPLGTDQLGRDMLARIMYGGRYTLLIGVLAVSLATVIGVPLGLISGYVGGWLDRILVLIMDALFAFPYLLLAIVVAFLVAERFDISGIATAAVSITVVYIPQYFRVVRNSTVSAKEATYVEAARAMGAGPAWIMWRYLFANVVQSVPVIATLNAADAILTLAGLGFLGYGIQPTDAAEWGYDLNRAVDDAASGIWWTGVFPGLAIVWLVVGLTFVGEGLNETLNPTLRVRRLLPVVLPPRDGAQEDGSRRRASEERREQQRDEQEMV